VVAAGTHAPAAWAWLRLALGFAQMGGAVLTATFLATLGSVDPWTIGAALGTTALTAASLALFPRGAR
jgi:hypothetical protein